MRYRAAERFGQVPYRLRRGAACQECGYAHTRRAKRCLTGRMQERRLWRCLRCGILFAIDPPTFDTVRMPWPPPDLSLRERDLWGVYFALLQPLNPTTVSAVRRGRMMRAEY